MLTTTLAVEAKEGTTSCCVSSLEGGCALSAHRPAMFCVLDTIQTSPGFSCCAYDSDRKRLESSVLPLLRVMIEMLSCLLL